MYIIFGGDDEATVRQILRTFDLNPKKGHIINGHVPVIVKKNESPLKAGGKLIVIDGGGVARHTRKKQALADTPWFTLHGGC